MNFMSVPENEGCENGCLENDPVAGFFRDCLGDLRQTRHRVESFDQG